MNAKLSAAALAFVAWVLYCLWLWQPERQVRKHHEHFIKAAENRNWRRVDAFVGPRYSDRWGHDKAFLLRESREILRQFFALSIESPVESCEVISDTATVSAKLKMAGTGTAIAEYAKNQVNALREPFVFEWKRQSWKPWDWALTRADHPQLQLQGESF